MSLSVLRVASCMAPNADETCRNITRYIGEHLGLQTEFVDDIGWPERERRLDAGDIHLCWLCGLPYIWKADCALPNVELVAAPVMAGERYAGRAVYFSDVVVRNPSRFAEFGDLRGASWAYNEPRSHSGYNVVLDHLHRLGETDGYFGSVVESGTHQRSLHMIADGLVDASAIDSTVLNAELNRFPHLREQIRVIDTLGPSPMPPWVMLKSLPEPIKQSIRELFLGMAQDSEGRAILQSWGMTRFAPVANEDYDPIRSMAINTERVRLSALV